MGARFLVTTLLIGCGGPLDRTRLSELGLFADIESKEIATGVDEYEPAFKLWSDGAQKRRFVKLPEDGQIDISDPDHWKFSVGTSFFKEFSKDGVRVETRVIMRESEDEYFMGAYAWRSDESDADLVEEGTVNADGQGYDIPSAGACITCHQSEPGRALGFASIQLRPELDVELPDHDDSQTAAVKQGLGYLHANCGHCHTEGGYASSTGLTLRMELIDGRVDASKVLAALERDWIVPGRAEESLVVSRMMGHGGRMPPLATNIVDDEGVRVVSAMIAALR